MLRGDFASLFWVVISEKRRAGILTLKRLAEKLGVNKSEPSRWFSDGRPNWTINTIADLAGALDVELIIRVRDRDTGVEIAPFGIVGAQAPDTRHSANAGPPVTYSVFDLRVANDQSPIRQRAVSSARPSAPFESAGPMVSEILVLPNQRAEAFA